MRGKDGGKTEKRAGRAWMKEDGRREEEKDKMNASAAIHLHPALTQSVPYLNSHPTHPLLKKSSATLLFTG